LISSAEKIENKDVMTKKNKKHTIVSDQFRTSKKVENLMSGILTNDNYYFARTLTLFKNQWLKLVCAKKTEIQKILVFFVEKYTFY
jgi:hypothetical protein